MDDRDIARIQAHLRTTFGAQAITLKKRPKQKDSAEVYIGEDFLGVVYDDEDGDGSFQFNMTILGEDLQG